MNNLIRNKRGNTLAFTMMMMIVVFLVVSIVVSLTQANLRQASAQERGLQAYYVARSGAEAAYEALLTTTPSLLKNATTPTDASTFFGNLNMVLTQNDIDFEAGTADVTAVTNHDASNPKIIITSVGTLKDSDISRTVTLEFYIDSEKYPEIIWSN